MNIPKEYKDETWRLLTHQNLPPKQNIPGERSEIDQAELVKTGNNKNFSCAHCLFCVKEDNSKRYKINTTESEEPSFYTAGLLQEFVE